MSTQSDTQDVKVGIEQGGDTLFVKSGGLIRVDSGGSLTVAGVTIDASTLALNGLTATAAELNKTKSSTRVVVLAVSTAITELLHDNKIISMTGAGSARTFTLPVPVAGMRFRFVVGEVNTSGYLIKSVAGTHVMGGTIMTRSDNSAAVLGYTAGATDDTITLSGSTTGGVSIGDWVELVALSATQWAVTGLTTSTGTEATPFSDTVT